MPMLVPASAPDPPAGIAVVRVGTLADAVAATGSSSSFQ